MDKEGRQVTSTEVEKRGGYAAGSTPASGLRPPPQSVVKIVRKAAASRRRSA